MSARFRFVSDGPGYRSLGLIEQATSRGSSPCRGLGLSKFGSGRPKFPCRCGKASPARLYLGRPSLPCLGAAWRHQSRTVGPRLAFGGWATFYSCLCLGGPGRPSLDGPSAPMGRSTADALVPPQRLARTDASRPRTHCSLTLPRIGRSLACLGG